MTGLKLTLLGGLDVRLDSGAGLQLPNKKAQALLAFLGTRPGQGHSRDKLATLLWGETSDRHARGGLRHALMALRRALADINPSLLQLDGRMVGLNPEAVDVDVVAFERRVAEGSPEALEQAAELYRGDLLVGFSVHEPSFEDWLVAERERLREMALEALAQLLAHQTKAAVAERAIQTAVRLLALDPLQESVHRTLMRLFARHGRRGAALKQYQACVSVLKRELGTEPEAETRRLYQELIRRPTESTAARRGGERTRPERTVGATPADLPAEETPLFGRQVELGRLRHLLNEAMAGHGQVVTVVGEAGIGKTRLVSTLAADAGVLGCRVLIGRCHESDSILPFGPWVDICRTGDVSADEEILDALHPARRAELTRLLPEASIAGLPPASAGALPLFESVAQLVEQVAARQPLMLVLEDLHWADEMSLRLLAFVSRRIPAWTALVVATARDEELAEASMARQTLEELARATQAMAIVLSPLSRSDTARLARALTRVGSDASTVTNVEKRVWAMSEGNPFVAVEAAHALDQGSLWAGPPEEPGVPTLPTRVRDLVARRLDRLSPRTQQLIAAAAVIGRRFDFGLLRSASGLEEHDAAEAVEEAVRLRVLQTVGNHLDFAHDRVRDVAYGRLLPPRRRLLHRAVVEALESTAAGIAGAKETAHRDRGGEQIEQLAHHALLGELPEKAAHYLRQAGQRAIARSALQDARVWFEQALAICDALAESPTTLEQAFEIRLKLASVLTHLGEGRRVLEQLREAEALAEQLHDDHRRARALGVVSVAHSLIGELDEAFVTGTRALETAKCLGDLGLRIATTSNLGLAHFLRGEHDRVIVLVTDSLATLPADRAHERLGLPVMPSIVNRAWLLLSLAEVGRFAEAAEHAAEAIRLAETTQHAYAVGWAHCSAGSLHLLHGNWMQARARMEHGIAALRTGNAVFELSTTIASSAWVLAQLGEANEALKRVQEGEQIGGHLAARGLVGYFGWLYVALGRACLLLGRLEQARRLADRALEFSARHPGYAAHSHHLLGDIAIHCDRFDAASGDTHYRNALALAEPRGMRPLVAHCHLGLGRLHGRVGTSEAAQDHLTTASTMYREMGMSFGLEQAENEASRTGRPRAPQAMR